MSTILIVDDEYLIADILSFALEDEGYLTVTAGSGQRALSILERERPHLIITDYMMPGMNGIELAEAVRGHKTLSTLPIMLMSGAQAHLGLARPDLFVEVFDKPFDLQVVLTRVKALLGPGPGPH
ncbi:response regulator [Pseudomonas sp. GD03842]|uniref:response regulator n=1 Tax=unclassified Pseudomonas TaxID=196821 RepID=UPI000D358316|nr:MULTISPECIES: response regulator [unclassified Pseudomonas]MDH0747758.1 response regulator [Pseudomonas sp. GD03842]RAU39900.1 response regulator [Pseudomonas sp. RIT 409]RAU46388.1 response regulator [Pseudomonas sp. RIT 412]